MKLPGAAVVVYSRMTPELLLQGSLRPPTWRLLEPPRPSLRAVPQAAHEGETRPTRFQPACSAPSGWVFALTTAFSHWLRVCTARSLGAVVGSLAVLAASAAG
jgi:hypothetical protein